MSSIVAQLDRITFERGGRRILNNVSWTIDSEANWVLLGANGSGKTTLLKVVTGYEWPTDGRVRVLDGTFGNCCIPEIRRAIGWVSSSVNVRLPGDDTAREIVLSGLAGTIGLYRQFNKDEIAAAESALASVGAGEFVEQRFDLLSQGEQQRVLIARGLINAPRLIVLDEPCIGLDPSAREHLLKDLTAMVGGSGCPSIIYVTHHVEEIRSWMTNTMVLKNGEVLAAGDTADVITSRLMSEAFGARCAVSRQADGYTMSVSP